jgi:hypothetical protein
LLPNFNDKFLHCIARIISNPFYCGYLTHSLIPGEIIQGSHPALVSVAAFLAANKTVATEPRRNIAKRFKIDALPLKTFAKAETAPDSGPYAGNRANTGAFGRGRELTGYVKKGLFYYKSRGKQSPVNVNAVHLNGLFTGLLRNYEYDRKYTSRLKAEISRFVTEEMKELLLDQTQKKKQLTELNNKIEKLEERFINSELTKDLFEKYKFKYEVEKVELTEKLKNHFESSNLEMIIEKIMATAENLSDRWVSSDYDEKRKLQSVIFPEGILYNKQKDTVRTLRVNTLFAPIPLLISFFEGKKKSNPLKKTSNSRLVVPTGPQNSSGTLTGLAFQNNLMIPTRIPTLNQFGMI